MCNPNEEGIFHFPKKKWHMGRDLNINHFPKTETEGIFASQERKNEGAEEIHANGKKQTS